VLSASGYPSDFFGESVASAGDVNGDGYDDVVIGNGANGVAGTAFLFLGGPGGVATVPDAQLQVGGSLYTSVGYAGDIDGDGFDDVLTGAPFGESATVYFGAPSVQALRGFALLAPGGEGNFGITVASRRHP
jgi:hypothetical protein